MSTIILKALKPRPWWFELLLVDFRHAFWPWVAYTGIVNFRYLTFGIEGNSASNFIEFFALMAIAPIIPVLIFSSDSRHATLQALLTYPRTRTAVWFTRLALSCVLLALPLSFGLLHYYDFHRYFDSGYYYPFEMPFKNSAVTAYAALVHGPLFSILFRKPAVAWSASAVAPFIEVVILGAIYSAGVPLPSLTLIYYLLPLGPILMFLAYRQWLRMEVRE